MIEKSLYPTYLIIIFSLILVTIGTDNWTIISKRSAGDADTPLIKKGLLQGHSWKNFNSKFEDELCNEKSCEIDIRANSPVIIALVIALAITIFSLAYYLTVHYKRSNKFKSKFYLMVSLSSALIAIFIFVAVVVYYNTHYTILYNAYAEDMNVQLGLSFGLAITLIVWHVFIASFAGFLWFKNHLIIWFEKDSSESKPATILY